MYSCATDRIESCPLHAQRVTSVCWCVLDDVEAPGESSGDPAASAHHQGVLSPLLAHGAARQPAHPAAAGAGANARRLLQLPAAPAAASAGPALRTQPGLLPTADTRAARPAASQHLAVTHPQTPTQDLQERVGPPRRAAAPGERKPLVERRAACLQTVLEMKRKQHVPLKRRFSRVCQKLVTFKLFQTCLSFFLLLNTKKNILKNVGNQKADGTHRLP